MTQEDKQLLLTDLSARLPYGVKVWYKYGAWYPEKFATSIRLADEKIALSHKFNKEGDWFPIEEAREILIKPYLRPMSSMTKEERKDLLVTVVGEDAVKYFQVLPDGSIDNTDVAHQDLEKFIMHWINFDSINTTSYIDWFNVHHFDYRGLIEKGLAIEVTEENNPYKE